MKILLLLFVAAILVLGSHGATDFSVNVSPSLLAIYERKATADTLITMRDRPDSVLAKVSTQSFTSRGARITGLYTPLAEHADQTQAPVLKLISGKFPKAATTSFWITNQIFVRDAPLSLVQLLVNRSATEILKIDEDRVITLPRPIEAEPPCAQESKLPEVAEWGVVMVRAPQVWESPEFRANGSGVTVGIIDSGVRWTHEALRDNYKNDSYSWYDPWTHSTTPSDGYGHGTHVAGTILGNSAQGIGVAPGAQWMACAILADDEEGAMSSLIECGQFMACPTRPNGQDPDCSHAPHIVSNSWGNNQQGSDFYNDVIATWHMADIIPVFAIGNDGGDGCSSAGSPGDQPDVISVGATTISDSLAYFSSLGPSVDGRRKPEISAPGHWILSADASNDSGYRCDSGTSMATPHVSGVIALLLSYKPFLKFNQIKAILETTADHDLTFNHAQTSCDGYRNDRFPNNHFGHGRINAYKAMVEAQDYNHGSHTHPCASIITLMFMLSAAIVLLVQKTAF